MSQFRHPVHCCRLCQGCGANNDVLLAALGGKLPGRTVMLQASGSFFAYEPVLRALQTRRPMPLAHYIAACKLNPDAPKPPSPEARRAEVGSLWDRLFSRRSGNGKDLCHLFTCLAIPENRCLTDDGQTQTHAASCLISGALLLSHGAAQLRSKGTVLEVIAHFCPPTQSWSNE